MHNIQLIPECYAETEMVKILFGNLGYLNHASGIHEVCKILKKNDIVNYINIGFIDKDKYNTPPYFDDFIIVDSHHDLVFFKKHPSSNDYLIVVNPAIEKFLWSQLQELKKEPTDYGLPSEFKKFKDLLKKERIQYNEGYKRMILDFKHAKTSGILFIMNNIAILQQ